MKKKSIPGAVLGIIGAVFCIIGGLGFALCADVMAGLSGGAINFIWAAYVLGLGSGVVALIGAVLDFSKPVAGGILLCIAVIMGIALCIIMYWSWAMIISLVLNVLAAILSFAVQKKA